MSDPNNALLSELYREYMRADPYMHKPYSKWLEERVETLAEALRAGVKVMRRLAWHKEPCGSSYDEKRRIMVPDPEGEPCDQHQFLRLARAALSTGEDRG